MFSYFSHFPPLPPHLYTISGLVRSADTAGIVKQKQKQTEQTGMVCKELTF